MYMWLNEWNDSAPSIKYDDENLCDVKYDWLTKTFYHRKDGCWVECEKVKYSVDTSGEFEDVVEWALKKMRKEKQLKRLAEEYPEFAEALKHYENALAMVEIVDEK